jgi:hypothetical protein
MGLALPRRESGQLGPASFQLGMFLLTKSRKAQPTHHEGPHENEKIWEGNLVTSMSPRQEER